MPNAGLAATARRSRRSERAAAGSGQYGDVLEADVSSVGQVAMTEGVLVAQEVDEKTVQTSKMLDQVTQVAESDPEGAAALLEQWMQRSNTYER